MLTSKIRDRYRKSKNSRIYQGDIFKDLTFVVGEPDRAVRKDLIGLEYAVVLSQDCDLEHDFNFRRLRQEHDKYLRSVLVCPAFNIEKFAAGMHIEGWKMREFYTNDLKKLKKNDEYKRYHFLAESIDHGVPELVLDFKHFFTLPRDFLYKIKKQTYVASLSELFREDLSHRFSNYLSRVGLPEFKDLS